MEARDGSSSWVHRRQAWVQRPLRPLCPVLPTVAVAESSQGPIVFCLLPCRETSRLSWPSEAHPEGLEKTQHGFTDKGVLRSKQLENSVYSTPVLENANAHSTEKALRSPAV